MGRLWITLVALAATFSCGDSDKTESSSTKILSGIELDLEGLQPLEEGYVYEAFLLVDENPVSAGRFNLTSDGALVDEEGNALADNILPFEEESSDAFSSVIVTIEPQDDDDASPSQTRLLSGEIKETEAGLSLGHQKALGVDFSTSTGVFVLATPSTLETSDEGSGVWFFDDREADPMTGLQLPVLPEGWEYEAWVSVGGVPISAGRFTDPGKGDDQSAFGGGGVRARLSR